MVNCVLSAALSQTLTLLGCALDRDTNASCRRTNVSLCPLCRLLHENVKDTTYKQNTYILYSRLNTNRASAAGEVAVEATFYGFFCIFSSVTPFDAGCPGVEPTL